MSTPTITQLKSHPVHLDPIEEALALLADSAVSHHLVCDGSCNGVSSCAVAPVDSIAAAA